MKNITIRISDGFQHAEEFSARTYLQFIARLARALDDYRSWYAGKNRGGYIPSPYLHVRVGSDWIDAGYGRGTYIAAKLTILENRERLRMFWSRCNDATANGEYFDFAMRGIVASITATDESRVRRNSLTVIDGGKK